ncbi:hypothetical protein [Bacteroides sp. 519]|uniref:hypothetical protein n=1 Tax=Bacteroides sp. 519 TaxID=2302937 RepID=UPI0013D045DD|nr:hypothetical protein [Bacteroides sp. 519]NDV59880.1 hypothetical protein [Bacteroides sp. 519]
MKTQIILVAILAILSVNPIKAQIKEKGFLIEGTVSYADTHNGNYIIITPTIGYQFNKYIIGGFKVGFETRDYPYTMYTPFVRYNYLTISKFQLFIEAQFNIAERDVSGGQSGYSEGGFTFGATYPICKNVKISGQYLFLGWSENNRKEGAWLNKSKFGLDANIQRLHLGIQIII